MSQGQGPNPRHKTPKGSSEVEFALAHFGASNSLRGLSEEIHGLCVQIPKDWNETAVGIAKLLLAGKLSTPEFVHSMLFHLTEEYLYEEFPSEGIQGVFSYFLAALINHPQREDVISELDAIAVESTDPTRWHALRLANLISPTHGVNQVIRYGMIGSLVQELITLKDGELDDVLTVSTRASRIREVNDNVSFKFCAEKLKRPEAVLLSAIASLGPEWRVQCVHELDKALNALTDECELLIKDRDRTKEEFQDKFEVVIVALDQLSQGYGGVAGLSKENFEILRDRLIKTASSGRQYKAQTAGGFLHALCEFNPGSERKMLDSLEEVIAMSLTELAERELMGRHNRFLINRIVGSTIAIADFASRDPGAAKNVVPFIMRTFEREVGRNMNELVLSSLALALVTLSSHIDAIMSDGVPYRLIDALRTGGWGTQFHNSNSFLLEALQGIIENAPSEEKEKIIKEVLLKQSEWSESDQGAVKNWLSGFAARNAKSSADCAEMIKSLLVSRNFSPTAAHCLAAQVTSLICLPLKQGENPLFDIECTEKIASAIIERRDFCGLDDSYQYEELISKIKTWVDEEWLRLDRIEFEDLEEAEFDAIQQDLPRRKRNSKRTLDSLLEE